ncbi:MULTISPECIES: carbohydrate ABC transporter permease [unclassified Rhizobium]|uniref:carbohydrate ABC transporter permease n=1 Tax=unclassified Rhizobium TaxID=2613769 RepID=UPI001ADB6CBD|nr:MULTISPECIES: sugar ABC transporter permease [unclassified Rhizobium]MBO9099911.1 sugar ABC transporter permease [Rhizobium sp. L58/93]MBO9169900.1 sugar ABC transporter permease [Rhizobium sp. L245/93]MBO9185858.1 sugar ABC transporter permease [Rhizobium sp. E27B/91]QXZ82620.1 sugar ABC transporter permease [Rhizobium sp. K1/93]QXZ89867.1 sugar ABC transporter permease [Rhizobium sp. K15/93]
MASIAFDAVPAKRTADIHARSEARTAWLLASPAIVLMVVFVLLPVIAVIGLGFTNFELGIDKFRFVGLDNYAHLFSDRTFKKSLWNTTVYTAIVAPVSIILGLGVALLIESETTARSFFRTAYFLPVASLIVAMATVWQYLFHPTIGPINAMLAMVGLPGPNWLGSAGTVLYSLSIIGVWQSVGFNMVLFLAGLTAIPRELYAAAEVDGARSAIDRFRLVTWPMLAPTTLFVTTISIINAVKVFETVQTLTEGGPNRASEVLLFTIYHEGFVYLHVGYASAMTVVFLVILMVLTFLQYNVLDKRVHYS